MGKKENEYVPHPGEAWSFAGTTPPGDLVHTEVRNGIVFYIYRDKLGDLWYNTDCGMRFAKEMEEAERRKRGRKRKQKNTDQCDDWSVS
ncbi:MAG: hypothetical protein PHP50_10140 [Lachnospiraceae bacterium]|nr:hypothetical protein [Lachnospiraceae bacterium]